MLQEWKLANRRAVTWKKLYQALMDAVLRELAGKCCSEKMD